MAERVITIVGTRGGSGTSTVAAVTALFASRYGATELVAIDTGAAGALLGVAAAQGESGRIDVTEQLAVVRARDGTGDVAVIDADRLDQLGDAPEGLLLAVLRGPCYLGLRSIVITELRPDGVVLLAERGRSLTRRDVEDVCGVPVVAEIAVTSNVARTIDAGLLVARARALHELSALRRYVATVVPDSDQPRDNATPAANLTASNRSANPATLLPRLHPSTRQPASKNCTDLPVPLNSGTGRCAAISAAYRQHRASRHAVEKAEAWGLGVQPRRVGVD